MNKHTPGPWVAHHNGHYWTVKAETDQFLGRGICDFIESEYLYSHDPRSEGAEANARFVAAAPDMLDALMSIVNCGDRPAVDIARAAISKATGEQP